METVTNLFFWVKAYDQYNRPSHFMVNDRDVAYVNFATKRDSGEYMFVQMGARADEGALVLNEWRPS